VDTEQPHQALQAAQSPIHHHTQTLPIQILLLLHHLNSLAVLPKLFLDSQRWHLLQLELFWHFKEGCVGNKDLGRLEFTMSNFILLEITLLEGIFQ
jgi:hypothetical protein